METACRERGALDGARRGLECRSVAGWGKGAVLRLLLVAVVGVGTGSGTWVTAADDGGLPRLTYRRVFKGSSPEYLSITVDTNGVGTYDAHKLDESPNPRPLKLTPSTTQRLFEYADTLHNLKSIQLESHKDVANLGKKTLIYEEGGQRNEVEFNFTVNRDARDLSELFEKIASVEQHIIDLEYAIRYDHLGLPRELLEIQIALDNRALADPQLLVPTLEQIARDPKFLHLAQVRAQNILDRLQNYN